MSLQICTNKKEMTLYLGKGENMSTWNLAYQNIAVILKQLCYNKISLKYHFHNDASRAAFIFQTFFDDVVCIVLQSTDTTYL